MKRFALAALVSIIAAVVIVGQFDGNPQLRRLRAACERIFVVVQREFDGNPPPATTEAPGNGKAGVSTGEAQPDAARRRQEQRRLTRDEARRRAKKTLAWADAECQKRADECLQPLARFFQNAKQGLPTFADEALGWRSKWYLGVDYVPWTSHERHATFLREKFQEHIFGDTDLQLAMKQCFEAFRREVESVESEMLVELRLDMAGLPDSALPEFIDAAGLHRVVVLPGVAPLMAEQRPLKLAFRVCLLFGGLLRRSK
ncbi:MAG TPA: hypothetical protein VMV69_20500 [Pirellulales bacterium]|nr:hypothetical protein [Pirellulales bacterium]